MHNNYVVKKQWTLLEAGELSEAVEIGFDIDLPELKASLRDTFDGQFISLRHSIGFRIVRPWYTFSVRGEEDVAIANACLPDTAPPEPTETVLRIDDFGGVCEFDHGKCTFNADAHLIGSLSFSGLSTDAQAIAKAELIIGRTEQWAASQSEDSEVRRHVLHGDDQSPIQADRVLPVDIALTDAGSEAHGVAGPLARSMAPLVPDDSGADSQAIISVTYWVRILLTAVPSADPKAAPKQFWATHPILILPSKDAGSV